MPLLGNASCSHINQPFEGWVRVNIRPISRLPLGTRTIGNRLVKQDLQEEHPASCRSIIS